MNDSDYLMIFVWGIWLGFGVGIIVGMKVQERIPKMQKWIDKKMAYWSK